MQQPHTLRRQDRALSLEASWALLREAAVGRLGLATSDGSPYVVPLNHVVYNDEICFHCATAGRKLSILRENPQVCYEVDSLTEIKIGRRACDFTANYKSAIAFGQAYEINDDQQKAEILNALTTQHTPAGVEVEPVTAADVSRVVVIAIKVDALTGKARSDQA